MPANLLKLNFAKTFLAAVIDLAGIGRLNRDKLEIPICFEGFALGVAAVLVVGTGGATLGGVTVVLLGMAFYLCSPGIRSSAHAEAL